MSVICIWQWSRNLYQWRSLFLALVFFLFSKADLTRSFTWCHIRALWWEQGAYAISFINSTTCGTCKGKKCLIKLYYEFENTHVPDLANTNWKLTCWQIKIMVEPMCPISKIIASLLLYNLGYFYTYCLAIYIHALHGFILCFGYGLVRQIEYLFEVWMKFDTFLTIINPVSTFIKL